MSEQERIAIKETLNEIYVAGDELQTYENLVKKLMELREPLPLHCNAVFIDKRKQMTDAIRAEHNAPEFDYERKPCKSGKGYIHIFRIKDSNIPNIDFGNYDLDL